MCGGKWRGVGRHVCVVLVGWLVGLMMVTHFVCLMCVVMWCRTGLTSEIDYEVMAGNATLHGRDHQMLQSGVSLECEANAAIGASVMPSVDLPSFSGSWSDSVESAGYGGEWSICVDESSGMATGLYSEVGFTVGTVTGNVYEGNWYEVGPPETGPNNGAFRVEVFRGVNGAADWIDGWWSYAGSDEKNPWVEPRTNSSMPTPSQCWSGAGGSGGEVLMAVCCVLCVVCS